MNDFQRLYSASFHHILPIIPPDATISSHSLSLRPELLGKVPGLLREDGWVGMSGWERHEVTDSDLQQWAEDGAGVGMRCHDVVAVDIDVTDPALAALIELECFTWLGFGPIRTGNAPKRLMLLRLAEPGSLASKRVLSCLDWTGQKHLIELLGARQQFVVQGMHPKTQKPYTWDQDLADLGLDGLPVVTVDELEAFLAHCQETLEMYDCETLVSRSQIADARAPEALRCDDMEFLRDAVLAIPNDEHTDREEFVRMAHAVKAAASDYPEDGLAIFEAWADQWPEGQRDGEVERVFRSVQDAGIGVQWLLDKAKENGFTTWAPDFNATAEDEAAAALQDAAPKAEAPNFWATWCYVNKTKRFINLRSNDELDKEQFRDVYVELGDGEDPVKFMLSRKAPGTWADDVDYRPGSAERLKTEDRTGKVLLNRWKPGPAHTGEWDGEASTADIQPWLDMANHLFADPNERDLLMNWMAHLLQHPGVKPNWHPLVGSHVHGTGKDSFFEPLVRGLGHNVSTIRTGDLENQWTWWAENVQLVVVSEISSFERRSIMQKLKSYTAAPPHTIEINKKGQGQYHVPNLFGMVFFTNNEDAVALERSDRRFFVVWSDAGVREAAFYERYHTWLENGGARAVVQWLKARDLSGFSVKGNAPSTAAKEDMRRAALSQVEGTLVDAVENGIGPFAADLVTMTQVKDWLTGQVKTMPSPNKLAVMLRSVGGLRLGKVRVDGAEGTHNLWAMRRTSLYAGMELPAVRDSMLEQQDKARNNVIMADFR